MKNTVMRSRERRHLRPAIGAGIATVQLRQTQGLRWECKCALRDIVELDDARSAVRFAELTNRMGGHLWVI